jgi:hypothetical protein
MAKAASSNNKYLDLVQVSINEALLSQQVRSQHLVVDDGGTLELRQDQVADQDQFESVVEGNPVEENVREELDDGEETVDAPVGEPLTVVVLVVGFNGFEGLVGGPVEI